MKNILIIPISKFGEEGAVFDSSLSSLKKSEKFLASFTSLWYKGYELVPISQLIYKDKYHMKADGTQVSGE